MELAFATAIPQSRLVSVTALFTQGRLSYGITLYAKNTKYIFG